MKLLVIPDCQIRPNDDTSYLTYIGRYITDKKPDVVVCIGDFADMPSLSSYDVGKKSFEGRRYTNDVASVRHGMDCLLAPLVGYNESARRGHRERYKPRLVLTLGNHENRIARAVESDPKLDGVMSWKDLKYEEKGWEVHQFLEVVVIEGVAFSHYFVTGVAGRAAGTAAAQLRKTNMSSISGHQQGLQIANASRADGARLTSIIAGSCYEHDEDYLGPQGNRHWRGCLMLHNVKDGEFDLVSVPLHYLKERYASVAN